MALFPRLQARRVGRDSVRAVSDGSHFCAQANRSVIRSRGFGINSFFFDGATGFLPERRVTSPLRAETDTGSHTTHSEYLWLWWRRFSTAYWCPSRRLAGLRLYLFTIAWSRWISVRPRRMFVLCFSISFVTEPMNSRPRSTWRSCGHFKVPRL